MIESTSIINFKADPETLQALEELEAQLDAGILGGRRSIAIRQAIQEAAREGLSAPIKRELAGRPRASENRPETVVLNFMADSETLLAIVQIETKTGPGIGRRSAIIRQAILDARDRRTTMMAKDI